MAIIRPKIYIFSGNNPSNYISLHLRKSLLAHDINYNEHEDFSIQTMKSGGVNQKYFSVKI